MSRYVLQNEEIQIAVDSHGAELKSLVAKGTNTEYMWQADPAFWGRTSPVLFPFVGSVREKQYRTNGQVYEMGQHGFARDMEFLQESQTEDTIWFVLRADEETLRKYPYEFVLKLGYQLSGRSVRVIWYVENPGTEDLPFSIGGHPAFLCPIREGTKQTDYQILFEGADRIVSTRLENGLASSQRDSYVLQDGYLPITEDLFDRDALVIEQQDIKKVALCDAAGKPYLKVEMDAPLFGIWSPPRKNAPFICIEPWYGRCDAADFDGELKERAYGNLILPGETWEVSYTVCV